MALPLGKLTILVGAGVIGSVLAQEGRISEVSSFFSGAFKIFFKHIQRDESPSTGKPRSDALLAQVNSLREELQLLASSRSVTIISTGRSGSSKYGVPIVIIGVAGYGYIWWKGWKFSDLMFATRRSLSDACTTVARQLEEVHSSLRATKKYLSKRIEHVDKNLDECKKVTTDTRDEVALLREDLSGVGVDFRSVHHAVLNLETRIDSIEGKQDITNAGVLRLRKFVEKLEHGSKTENVQILHSSSSTPALELPNIKTTSRTASLPPVLPAPELPSPSACNQTPNILRPVRSPTTASGFKVTTELQGLSNPTDPAASSSVTRVAEDAGSSSGSLSSGGSEKRSAGYTASLLMRTRSVLPSFR